jgi:hypothetical protein
MSTYIIPQTLIYQELALIPSAQLRDMPAHIAGGHAHLIRYAQADEKAFGYLGQYDRLQDVAYDWPNRPAGATVDDSYVKVYIDDALLMYYENTIGTGDTILTVAGEPNQVRAAATRFKSNGASYARSAVFKDRDVAIGDAVKLRAVVGSQTYDLFTYVAGFVAETVAAVIGEATEDSSNQATVTATTSNSKTGGSDNCVVIDSVNGAAYDGLEDGDVEETYTILVTQASAGGDATTAQLRVTSASGNDDDLVLTPSAFGVATAVGSRGLTVTWNNSASAACSLSAADDGVDQDDFVVGQQWEVTVRQAFDASDGTVGGSYTGTSDLTYIVEVTKGGLWADSPQITVTTDKGTDASGPTTVSAAGTAVAVGSYGVTISFDEDGLCKGDRFYIEVDAASEGAIQTIELGNNLPEDVIDNGATEVDLTLYIRKDIEVSQNRTGAAPLTNWSTSATQVTLKSGITAYDSSYTDDGALVALPVYGDGSYSLVYVEVRYWLSDLCSEVNSCNTTTDLASDISGELHPDNPLKWGVYKALQNSNGTPVKYTAVCDPDDVTEWSNVLSLLDGRKDVYGLVPLTRNATVQGLYQTHVNNQSGAEFAAWRVCWPNQDAVEEKAIVNTSSSTDEEVVMATLEDDPNAAGTQYTLLKVPAKTGQFVTNGVQANDIVRFLYTTDGFGNTTYTEFTVDAVLNEDTIRLYSGHTVPVSVAQKIEVWRDLTDTQLAADLALTLGYSDRRVMMVWPDEIGQDGYTVAGYFACACLAGLASGVQPHQGLTRLEIAGCDEVPRTTEKFNRTQLNTMAAGGVLIITQDPESGDIFARHAVTTADYDVITEREEMITRNLDNISYYFFDIWDPYIGISNVVESMETILEAETRAGIKNLEGNAYTARLGGQLVSGEIEQLRPHATLRDRFLVELDLTLPFPLNNIEAHLKLVA